MNYNKNNNDKKKNEEDKILILSQTCLTYFHHGTTPSQCHESPIEGFCSAASSAIILSECVSGANAHPAAAALSKAVEH